MSGSGSKGSDLRLHAVAIMAIAFVLIGLLVQESKPGHMNGAPGLKPRAHVLENFGKLPLAFEENRGQASTAADFVTRGGNFQVMLDPAGATFMMGGPAGVPTGVKDAKASPLGIPRVSRFRPCYYCGKNQAK